MELDIPISSILRIPPERKNYRLACPLHGSANPTTLHISDDRFFFCFACHAGGTAVELYAEMERIPRTKALAILSQKYPPLSGLKQAAQDLDWRLKKMQLSPLPVLEFPEGLGETPYPLRGLGFPTLKHFGLRECAEGVCFPFRDVEGNLVGWSVRRAEGVEPKYLNSKGLKKSRILYGLYENQESIRKRKEVILVEGQFDALAVWDAGFTNVAAVLGSDLAREQVRLLLPWVDRIKVLFDADSAGREGAFQVRCKWQSVFSVKVLVLPEGEDPCSAGEEKLQEVLGAGN